MSADLEESQLEVQKLTRQQKKLQQSVQGLEEEVRAMKNTKRLSITGLDTEDYKTEIAK